MAKVMLTPWRAVTITAATLTSTVESSFYPMAHVCKKIGTHQISTLFIGIVILRFWLLSPLTVYTLKVVFVNSDAADIL